MPYNPAYQEAQYAHQTYRQRRIDIADAYSRQCDANRDDLVKELAAIAFCYDLAPTRVVTYAFGNSRPDFIGRVRRALAASKAGAQGDGAARG